uniref:G-protein coupled receptors family 1 profile domain-containing protein n=1 Tax=Piliocolobus tephrosceles TaxID=591936 RepID=A0A8C9H3S4_9PRIM
MENILTSPWCWLQGTVPGLEGVQFWIAFLFCATYAVAVVGNITLLHVIRIDHTLHKPMYLFLAMLPIADLVLSSSSQPKVLAIFWFHAHEIKYHACLIQVFFIHAFSFMEPGVLMAMALDRYVAICFPLRHYVISKIAVAVLLRSVGTLLPVPLLIKRLACADISVNSIYGLLAVIFIIVLDALILLASYILILHAVLNIASQEERLKALNTCLSHICARLLFYVPLMCMTLIHRYGKHLSPLIHTFMANIYLLFPPVLNPIVYSVTIKQIQWRIVQAFCGARVSP